MNRNSYGAAIGMVPPLVTTCLPEPLETQPQRCAAQLISLRALGMHDLRRVGGQCLVPTCRSKRTL